MPSWVKPFLKRAAIVAGLLGASGWILAYLIQGALEQKPPEDRSTFFPWKAAVLMAGTGLFFFFILEGLAAIGRKLRGPKIPPTTETTP